MQNQHDLKQCQNCKNLKNKSDFYKKSSNSDGLKSYCKNCCKQKQKEDYHKSRDKRIEYRKNYVKQNKEKVLKQRREYYNKNKDKINEKNKTYATKSKEKVKDRTLKYNYGISLNEYNKLINNQNNKCLICKKEELLVVDHCHTSGKIRGLLCNKCNLAIGLFSDNLDTLSNAIKYLKLQR